MCAHVVEGIGTHVRREDAFLLSRFLYLAYVSQLTLLPQRFFAHLVQIFLTKFDDRRELFREHAADLCTRREAQQTNVRLIL